MPDYNSSFTGEQIDQAVDQVVNEKVPAGSVKFSDGQSFQQKYDSGELDGEAGKSAYEAARDAGFQGTEEEFNQALSSVSGGPFLSTKGGTMSGPINMNGQRITGLPKPAGGNDPMRKDDGASASTLGLYGLSADGTVDDVLALLGRFHSGLGNEYLWAKQELKNVESLVNEISTGFGWAATCKYSDSVELKDGKVVLVSPITSTFQEAKPILEGKYFWYESYSKVFKATSVTQVGPEETVPITCSEVILTPTLLTVGYVNSPDSDAYPPSKADKYTYAAIGQLGSFARMETGSYIGTGKYGADNPNSLTFKFVPKFVLIFWAENGNPNNAMAFLSADGGISYKPGGSNGQWFYASGIEVKITGTTITWYASSLQIQMNGSVKYQYLAIG